jgi:hypothetical protein
MLALGGMGLILSLLFFSAAFASQVWRSGLAGTLVFVTVALFVARAALHVGGGIVAFRGQHPTTFATHVKRYWVASWLSLLLLVVTVSFVLRSIVAVPLILVLAGVLNVWPFMLRGLARRATIALYANDAEVRDADPDQGVTALGYVLLATGVFGLISALVTTWASGSWLGAHDEAHIVLPSAFGDHWSLWVCALLAAWAGIEQVLMTRRWRLASLTYGISVAALACLFMVPELINEFPLTPSRSAVWCFLVLTALLLVLPFRPCSWPCADPGAHSGTFAYHLMAVQVRPPLDLDVARPSCHLPGRAAFSDCANEAGDLASVGITTVKSNGSAPTMMVPLPWGPRVLSQMAAACEP